MEDTLQTTGDELLKDLFALKVDIAKLKERKIVLTKVLLLLCLMFVHHYKFLLFIILLGIISSIF